MIRAILRNAGLAPRRVPAALRGWMRYVADRRIFRKLMTNSSPAWGPELPMLTEWDEFAGSPGVYFYQDRLVASWVHENNPERHVDVGSRIDGFVGSLSAFRKVEVIDIRPLPDAIPNIEFRQLNLMDELPSEWKECTDSLSCLHTIEHFGLGRYGDPLDPLGHLKGLNQLKVMVKPGGILYLSTPIGPERVEFNAHRVFGVPTLLGWFRDGWTIERFAVIDDASKVHEAVDWKSPDIANHHGCHAGVGIIAIRKI